MTDTLNLTGQYSLVTCCHKECGISFGIPATVERQLRNSHDGFFCPRGHPLVFKGGTEEEKLRDQLAAKARTIEYLEAAGATARADRDHFKRSAAIVKGKHGAMKKRIAAGICPCCKRPFANLMRHMQHQHPTFSATEA